jgi:hypothetical protein
MPNARFSEQMIAVAVTNLETSEYRATTTPAAMHRATPPPDDAFHHASAIPDEL